MGKSTVGLQLSAETKSTAGKTASNKNLDHKELDSKHAATFSSYVNSHTVLDDTLV